MKIKIIYDLLYCLGIVFSTFILTSCIHENWDDCPKYPEYNLLLYFEYLDTEGNDKYPAGNGIYPEGSEIFSTRLQTVDVLLYDAYHRFYKWVNCNDIIINNERVKKLSVAPGDYYIIGWGNNISHRNDYQALFPDKTLGDSYIYHYGEKSADPLHYAPDMRGLSLRSPEETDIYRVTVKQSEITKHTLSFMSAHRTLNIYIRGFYEVEEDDRENPVVSVSNLASYYDNYLGRGVENAKFSVQATQELIYNQAKGDRELLGYATFYLPHFDNENDITLELSRPALSGNYEHTSITMKYILEKLELDVQDGDDLVIDVLIEFNGTYVTVKVPEWTVNNIDWK